MYGAPTVDTTTLGRPRAAGLGLGLGLNRFQRGRFLEAAQGGGQAAQDYLASRPMLQRRIENRVEAGTPQEARLQNFMATGVAPSGATLRYGPRPPAGAGAALSAAGTELGGQIDRGMTPEESGAGVMPRAQQMAEARTQLRTARQGLQQNVQAARQQARPAVRAARQNIRGIRRGVR